VNDSGDDRPIGVFDSGFGGLSILQAIRDLLPGEHIEYFGDSARYPYGSKSQAEVRRFALQIGDYLVGERGVKALVVACNTASAAALDDLRIRYDIPVLGVIDAGVRAAIQVSRSRSIGLIATVGTVGSGAYQGAFEMLDAELEVTYQACPGLVEFVEQGKVDSEEVVILLRALLEPVVHAKVDTLLLGCTHYPFLSRAIRSVVGDEVLLVSSGEETAFELRALLDVHTIRSSGRQSGRTQIMCSGDPIEFERVGATLVGLPLGAITRVTMTEEDERKK
jgi:glutamate racemase